MLAHHLLILITGTDYSCASNPNEGGCDGGGIGGGVIGGMIVPAVVVMVRLSLRFRTAATESNGREAVPFTHR